MKRFTVHLVMLAIMVSAIGPASSSQAQTSGFLQIETHVSGTIGSNFNRLTPSSAGTGPIVLYDPIVASINGAPPTTSTDNRVPSPTGCRVP